ncbi:MAG: methyltransferase domain-containing protein, partial [Chloroflexota bacterium]
KHNATDLPFDDSTMDVVLCAQTLQFLSDRVSALSEMKRIAKPDGLVAVSLWCDIAKSPYFDALVATIAETIGEDTASGLGSAFKWTDVDDIRQTFVEAGFEHIETHISTLELELPPIDAFVPRHINATPMSKGYSQASDDTRQAIIQMMSERLADYVTDDGLAVPFCSHIVHVRK